VVKRALHPLRLQRSSGLVTHLLKREMLRNALETAMHEAEHNLSVSRAELIIANKQFDIAKESVKLAQKAFSVRGD